jgi:hypothetical protein
MIDSGFRVGYGLSEIRRQSQCLLRSTAPFPPSNFFLMQKLLHHQLINAPLHLPLITSRLVLLTLSDQFNYRWGADKATEDSPAAARIKYSIPPTPRESDAPDSGAEPRRRHRTLLFFPPTPTTLPVAGCRSQPRAAVAALLIFLSPAHGAS